MFGTNEIIGKKYFKDAPADSLFVTSMFFTLQGEGPYAGMPALFIRLAKCNLVCSFCDTFFDDGDWMTYDQIEGKMYAAINDYWNKQGKATPTWANNGLNNYPGVVLVMTGGEPLLQENISAFMTRQLAHFKAVQVESNGIPVTDVPAGVTLVCSPKCAEKDGRATKYFAPSATILQRADCLKFVMSADVDSPYNSVPQWAHDWKAATGKEIYCSPMNVYNSFPQKIKLLRAEKGNITMAERSTVDEVISFWEPGLLDLKANQANHEYAAHYCIEHGFKLNLQMHLYASLA
jgi:7-carboxy-7-deazaguanine synthase